MTTTTTRPAAHGLARLTSLDATHGEGLAALLEERAALGASFGGPTAFAGREAWCKGGPLRGKASWRHAARGALGMGPLPRERELRHLDWLARRLFQVPAPLAAASLWRGGRPRFQLLVTERVADATPFEEAFPALPASERAAVLAELAREVARMHALRFVHRDLFPRNLLLLPRVAPRRLVFLDAWAGGPGPGRRGPDYDVACLFLEAERLAPEEQARWLADYSAERARQGRPLTAGFAARVVRARAGLVARLRRDPARLRGRDLPGPWSPPAGALP